VPRDDRGGCSVLCVLGEHGTCDLGIVARREEDKPPVVAKIQSLAAGQGLALVRDDLRGSGFSRDAPGRFWRCLPSWSR
jgi:hypothetical protein